MKNWKLALISPTSTILDAIELLDRNPLKIVLVVSGGKKLIGTIVDGDIRRAVLRKIPLKTIVEQIMITNFTVATIHDDWEAILSKMKEKQLKYIPIIDNDGNLVGLKSDSDRDDPLKKDNIVVIMAGGKGLRLRPLTDNCPKPLLKLNGKPILETILENFIKYGYHRFFISVNYKASMIEGHFGDGSRWGCEITYLREDKKLGTAGALGYLPEVLKDPFLVMNGDLLTKVNFQQFMDFHHEHKSDATMAVREYDFQVPYGVINIKDNNEISYIDEKPIQRFFVNAGIYVLEPEILKFIPKNEYFDMTDLFSLLIKENYRATTFPIREYWLDIGHMKEFERAQAEYVCQIKNGSEK